jgi:hypothetical protein
VGHPLDDLGTDRPYTLGLPEGRPAGVIERVGVAEGISLHILTAWLAEPATLQLEGEYG